MKMNNNKITLSEEERRYIEDFYGQGGILTEEWWFDFLLGAILKGISIGDYEVIIS